VAGGWRRLHNEELRKLYVSQNIIRVTRSRRIRRVEHVACMGETRHAYKILVGEPEWKRPFGVGNIRLDPTEIG